MGTPTFTPITEHRHDGGFIVLEAGDGQLTRSAAILLTGFGFVEAGTVLGTIAHALTGTIAAEAGSTNSAGNATWSAFTVGDPAIAGVYTLEFLDATHFRVENPRGDEVGHGVLGAAFAAGGLGFTGTAGGTAQVVGDSFTITVAAGSLKYVPYDPTGVDGREFAAAVLFGGRDTTSADKKCVVNDKGPMRVNASELVWGANVTTTPQKTAALAALAALPGGGIQAT
jgi:hypothetical protein